jgi:uncharacterized protein YjdB
MHTIYKKNLKTAVALLFIVALIAPPQTAFAEPTVAQKFYTAPQFTATAPTASQKTIYVKKGATIKITGRYAMGGDKVKSGKSSKKSVATVSANGKLKAKKAGTTIITLTTKKGKKDTIKVKVVKKDKPAKKITLPKTKKLGVKETARLSVKISPASSTSTIKWSSSDTEIATVNAAGYVTAKSPGEVKITAKTSNGKKTVCKLTVNPLVAATAVVVDPAEAMIELNEELDLTAFLTSEDPNTPSNDLIKWTSSNEKIVTVSAEGKVTAVGVGTADVIAAAIGSGKKGKAKITVPALKADVRIAPGVSFKPAFKIGSKDDPILTYTSSDESVATVDKNGYVRANLRDKTTGHAVIGVAMIEVTTESGETGSVNVAVTDEPNIVDFSKWQGDIDWSQTHQAIDLAILRVSDGERTDLEKKYTSYADSCAEYGVPFGVYSFARYKTKAAAIKEATAFYKQATSDGREPLFFVVDIELAHFKRAHTEAYIAKLRELAEADGITRLKVGVYIGNHLYESLKLNLDTNIDDPATPDFIWIPRYNIPNNGAVAVGAKKPDHPCDLWQYSSSARIPGVGGYVDVSTLYDPSGARLSEKDYFDFEWLIAGPEAF